MSEQTNNSAYEKLSPSKKYLIDIVLNNMQNSKGIWTQGWASLGVPESGVTGKKYRGINNLILSLTALARGYKDSRWVTYHQIEEKGWHFKTDEEGKSKGKNAGVTIEFYELRDKETNKPFDRSVLDGMTSDEKQEYIDENIFPLRKYYRVFNGDIIEGIPELIKPVIDASQINERAENILEYWNENECPIVYGGNKASYKISIDRIHLPLREAFKNLHEFYGTSFHEIGHSTGSEKRLKRDMSGKYGSEKYALEELRAELSALFLEQEIGLEVSEKHIENNSLYIKDWLRAIESDPNALFTAIADANAIVKYVVDKERASRSEPYAIVTDENEVGDTVYGVRMASSYGQTILVIPYMEKEKLQAELEALKILPLWKDKEFYEVDNEMLEAISVERAEKESKKAEVNRMRYELPSAVAAKATITKVDMSMRGENRLTRISDIDVLERAKRTRGGEQFQKLYNGQTLFGNEEKDERALMIRLAMFCNGDEEQLMRVFCSSGQYRDEKPNAFYKLMAQNSIRRIEGLKENTSIVAQTGTSKIHVGLNSKT